MPLNGSLGVSEPQFPHLWEGGGNKYTSFCCDRGATTSGSSVPLQLLVRPLPASRTLSAALKPVVCGAYFSSCCFCLFFPSPATPGCPNLKSRPGLKSASSMKQSLTSMSGHPWTRPLATCTCYHPCDIGVACVHFLPLEEPMARAGTMAGSALSAAPGPGRPQWTLTENRNGQCHPLPSRCSVGQEAEHGCRGCAHGLLSDMNKSGALLSQQRQGQTALRLSGNRCPVIADHRHR